MEVDGDLECGRGAVHIIRRWHPGVCMSKGVWAVQHCTFQTEASYQALFCLYCKIRASLLGGSVAVEAGHEYDVFVSYAHSDDKIPEHSLAKFGWAIMLARNLNTGPTAGEERLDRWEMVKTSINDLMLLHLPLN